MNAPFDTATLVDNHLAFTRLHRGEVISLPGAFEIRSSLPGFSAAVLSGPSADAALLERHAQVRLVPGAEAWRETLDRAGFAEPGALRYMVLTSDFRAWPSNASVGIKTARDRQDIATFTE